MVSSDPLSLVMKGITAVGIILLLAPILMIFPLSLDSREIIQFPPDSLSLKWYMSYFRSSEWIGSTVLSLFIGLGASAIAVTLGTPAAIALIRYEFPFKRLFLLMLVGPLLLPLVVIAIAIFGVYSALGLVGSPLGIMFAHGVLGMPIVIITIAAAVTSIPRSYDEAAQSLGASMNVTILTVIIPLVWRSIAAGAVFSFMISFDEVIIAQFLSGTTSITLPRRMIDGIFFDLSPLLAAVSGCLIIFNTVLVVIGLFLTGNPYR